MALNVQQSSAAALSFEAWGARGLLTAESPELLARMVDRLPAGWRRVAPRDGDAHFSITWEEGMEHAAWRDGASLARSDLEIVLEVLDAHLASFIAISNAELTFLRAGAVAGPGGALLLPGQSFSGTSTLVRELAARGAELLSDRFAVLDRDGAVRAYPGEEGSLPRPVRLVVFTEYRLGAEWRPEPVSGGQAALSLLAHAEPAHERPAESLASIRRALEGAVILRGPRGEAAGVAADLLARLRS